MDEKNKTLVSVVVVTYNSSRYVQETLESVKAQTWSNIELIISDDGSQDNTVQICTEWIRENRKRFSQTKIISVDKNTGISANCNRGLRETTGEWVKLIAGDDALMGNCLTDNMEYARQFPDASFIVSDLWEMNENSVPAEKPTRNEALLFFAKQPSIEKQLKAYSRWPEFLNTPAFFYKKELVGIIGYCDEEFRIYEDMAIVFRVIGNGIKIHYLQKPTVKYRVHATSVSRGVSVELNRIREQETFGVFNKYRKPNLNLLNPLDLSVYYECWLRFCYKGFFGIRGDSLLRKFSLFYWYLKFNGVKNY